MKKPYIICHMMTSVDGRIDCAMTEHLPGVQEYYDTLDSLNAPTRVSGRVTAELELAGHGVFHSETVTPFGREGFSKRPLPPGTRSLRIQRAHCCGRCRRVSAHC